MTPSNGGGRPGSRPVVTADHTPAAGSPVTSKDDTRDGRRRATQLHKRAAAARRCPPLPGRHGSSLAVHDGYLPWPPGPRKPSTFSLTPMERRREAERLLASGWESWEVALVFVPADVAA
jgi:hypothetical protein